MSVRARVSFPHKGKDGSNRQVDDVVELSDEEFAIRQGDGFVQREDAGRPAAKKTTPTEK